MAPTAHESVATEAKRELRATQVLTALNVSLAIMAIFGYLKYLYQIPNDVARNTTVVADHEIRIRVLEADRGTLQRIDERTKAMQEDIQQIHRDFSFRASATPHE